MWNHASVLDRIKHQSGFDVVVVGGGVSGLGATLDAARRGLSVLLVEADDFGSRTSGRSTKLIHGGVRYLEQAVVQFDPGQLKQVRHGLRERRILLAQAPHLARPLGLCTPCKSWWSFFYLRVGLQLYAMLAGWRDPLPSNRFLSRRSFQRLFPALSDRFVGAVMYYDGCMDDARYCLAIAKTAVRAGALVVNHTRLEDFEFDHAGKIVGVILHHQLTDERLCVQARVVLNATGPAADVLRLKANKSLHKVMRPSKGVHISIARRIVPPDKALLIPQTADGRVVFAIPFGDCTIVGTTDTPWELPPDENCHTTSSEVAYLLETIAPYVKEPVRESEISAAFAGLRPLVNMPHSGRSTAQLLRDHMVEVDTQSGLVSLLGGKWTTYRLMAQDAVNTICGILGSRATSTTHALTLCGGEPVDRATIQKLPDDAGLRNGLLARLGSEVANLIEFIGARTDRWARLIPECAVCEGEVRYAIRYEMAASISDILHQRVRVGLQDWGQAKLLAPIVARILADELGWSDAQRLRELENYLSELEKAMQSLVSGISS